jgi:hypothetical protein
MLEAALVLIDNLKWICLLIVPIAHILQVVHVIAHNQLIFIFGIERPIGDVFSEHRVTVLRPIILASIVILVRLVVIIVIILLLHHFF